MVARKCRLPDDTFPYCRLWDCRLLVCRFLDCRLPGACMGPKSVARDCRFPECRFPDCRLPGLWAPDPKSAVRCSQTADSQSIDFQAEDSLVSGSPDLESIARKCRFPDFRFPDCRLPVCRLWIVAQVRGSANPEPVARDCRFSDCRLPREWSPQIEICHSQV